MDILQTKDLKYKQAIIEQYNRVFSTGFSAQLINQKELDIYIHTILTHGYAVLALENNVLAGSLLSIPLVLDNDLPIEIKNQFKIENCIYIAELMVEEEKRGKGIGRKLMDVFQHQLDTKIYSDIFIRVWEENTGALRLYEQSDFKAIGSIIQTKTAVDGFTNYNMKKIYLQKKLN